MRQDAQGVLLGERMNDCLSMSFVWNSTGLPFGEWRVLGRKDLQKVLAKTRCGGPGLGVKIIFPISRPVAVVASGSVNWYIKLTIFGA